MRLQPIALVLLLAAAIAFPLIFSNPFVTTIYFLTVIYAIAATSWNIFAGYTGYIALGHAVFFGTGAYALALICQHWNVPGDVHPFWLLPICGVVACVVALPIGAIALRARGHTFVVITIAVFFIFQLMAYNLRNFTKGSTGLSLPLILAWNAVQYNQIFIYVGLVILVLAFATSWFIRNSKYGLGLLAIRDDEDRARGLGVKTGVSKLAAFVISAFFVGMAGGLWAYYTESISPPFAFDALFDVAVALMTFMGGAGTLIGPLLGAAIIEPTQLYVAFLVQAPGNDALARLQYGLNLVIFGALFLVVLLLLPEGIIPTVRKRWIAFRAGRPSGAAPPRVAPAVAGASTPTGGPQQGPGDGEGPEP